MLMDKQAIKHEYVKAKSAGCLSPDIGWLEFRAKYLESIKQEGETPMCTVKSPTVNLNVDVSNPHQNSDASKRCYLANRLFQEKQKKIEYLRDFFHIEDDAAPTTVKELKERIASGKFVIDGDDNDRVWGSDSIRWRDPAVPADRAGYEAAQDRVSEAEDAAEDKIRVLSPAEGLAALEAFKAMDFTTA